jgi:glucokinase
MMHFHSHIGIDLGGTNIRAAVMHDGHLSNIVSVRLNALVDEQQVLQQVFSLVDPLFNNSISSVGIGVPGLVDNREKMVYDVVNIPAWKKIPLQQIIEEHYQVPVYVNNDANCFALGEYHFGKGRGYDSMVGLTIGTGLGSGVIINGKLHSGRNGGAGEFGMIPYLGQVYEYYASGQFFSNVYHINGETVFENAKAGNREAVIMYNEFGQHLGNAIMAILFAVDVELIVIGGSVKQAFPFYQKSMWQQLQNFPYQRATRHLQITVSELPNSALLGAAALGV